MNFLNKLERKYGKYAIHNLMYYIVILQIVGVVLTIINPYFYYQYLSLDIAKVLHGQVWRLVTFIISPQSIGSPIDILFLAISLYLYYYIGRTLESVWGAFRFNIYYLGGILFNIVAAFIVYFVFGELLSVYVTTQAFGLTYVNYSLFLAFAALYPDMELLYMFFIPLRMKYLGVLYGLYIVMDVYNALKIGNWGLAIAILVAILNFIIFFLCTRNVRRFSPKEVKRKKQYRSQVQDATRATRHRCAVCGRTEQDDENLEFRYCSKCEGTYEYCMDHLFTHEHVKKH